MSTKSQTIYEEYFEIEDQYRAKYGTQTVLLFQVGAFFEIYSRTLDGVYLAYTQQSNLNCSVKHGNMYDQGSLYMAGFRDYTLETYLQRGIEHNYTLVVFVQEKKGTKFIRKLQAVYSPGTFIPMDQNLTKTTNHLMCVWFHFAGQSQKQLICGYTVLNIFTGESILQEYEVPFWMNPTTFDELENAVAKYLPNELILVSPLTQEEQDMVLNYMGISSTLTMIHRIDSNTNAETKRAKQQTYIQHTLESILGPGTSHPNVFNEFMTYEIATRSLCFLFHFVSEHHPSLVKQLRFPQFDSSNSRVLLANHTLKQLNIVDGSLEEGGKYSSVLRFWNQCMTSSGKRLFQHQLTQPTSDSVWLQKEYDMIKYVSGLDQTAFLSMQLQKMSDLDKISRQIVTQRLYPDSIAALKSSLDVVLEIERGLDETWKKYLPQEVNVENTIEKIQTHMNQYLGDFVPLVSSKEKDTPIKKCLQNTTLFFIPGLSPELDLLYNESDVLESKLNQWRNYAQWILSGTESDEMIKIHETEKQMTLQVTKTRSKIIQKNWGLCKIPHPNEWKDVKFVSASTQNDEIVFSEWTHAVKRLTIVRQTIQDEEKRMWSMFIESLAPFAVDLHPLSFFIAKIDVILNKTQLAKTYRYCCPTLDTSSKTSKVSARGIRHVLLEHIQIKEIYVANDIELSGQGLLLYGHNTSGKTSLLRALGLCVVLAQAGCYVPCDEFHLHPFGSLFSRISSNDNMFRNMSSFAMEVCELRQIIQYADNRSLILADELCHSTEQESALSIVVATLKHLHQTQSCYLMTSHFHEIPDLIREWNLSIQIAHLHVYFDVEKKQMVFDRKLRNGSGSKTYGLEIMRSLRMPQAFLEDAFQIRKGIHGMDPGPLNHPISKYNSQKIRGKCEKCGKLSEETHHIVMQKNADSHGFVSTQNLGTFHKNHVVNLMALCRLCHDNEHHDRS